MIETQKEFMMSTHPLILEASLDKGVSSLYLLVICKQKLVFTPDIRT